MKCKILGKDVLDGFLNQASDSVTLISVTTDVEQCSITEEWRYYDSSECVIKYKACDGRTILFCIARVYHSGI